MAGILDALKNLDPSSATRAIESAASTGVSTVTAATQVVQAAQDMQKKMSESLDAGVATAKTYVAVTTTLQAIAAFAALGIFVVQVKQYGDMKRARRTSGNPRRRRRR